MMRNGLPAMAPVPLDLDFEKTEMKYDSTGMFHWVPTQTIEDCTMVRSLFGTNILHDWHIFRIEPNQRVS